MDKDNRCGDKTVETRKETGKTLWNLPVNDLRSLAWHEPISGSQQIVVDVAGLAYPLKIVVFTEEDIATVVTAYPLKRGDRR